MRQGTLVFENWGRGGLERVALAKHTERNRWRYVLRGASGCVSVPPGL